MKSLSLILRIIAIIAGITAAVLFFLTQGKLDEKETSLKQAQSQLQSANQEITSMNTKAAELEAKAKALAKTEAAQKQELNAFKAEVFTAKQEAARTQQKLSKAESEVAQLERTTQNLRQDLIAAQSKAASDSEAATITQLNERVASLETANNNLENELQAKSVALEALKSSSGPKAASETTATAKAQAGSGIPRATIGPETMIASIRTQDGVLTLNNTEATAMAPGQTFTLVKDYKALAKVQITELKEGLAVGNILPGSELKALSTGLSVNLLRL